MKILRAGMSLILAGSAAPLSANPDRLPILCGEPDQPEHGDEMPAVAAAALTGTYRCSAEGIVITLRLDVDGRFEQRMEGEAMLAGDGAGGSPKPAILSGRWRIEHRTLYLFQQPRRAPEIRLIATKRDPSVWMRVEVRQPDGKPAQNLFVGEGAWANPRSSLDDDGIVLVSKDYSWSPGVRQIVRTGDELSLITFEATRDGPNSFVFTYQPSEVEPFRQRGQIADARGDAVVIPLGIAGTLLRRIVPAR